MGMDSVAQAVFGLADQIVIEPFLSFFGKSHMSLTKKRITNRSLVHLGRTISYGCSGEGEKFPANSFWFGRENFIEKRKKKHFF